MTTLTKAALATITAILTLLATITTTSASQLSATSQTFRATWTSLELSNTITTNVVRCPITLEGSYHSATITKTVGALIGYVTRASVRGGNAAGECTGGRATVRGERLPWHIRYRGFSGELPRITSLTIGLIGASWTIETAGSTCNSTTEAAEPAVTNITLNRETGRVETTTPDRNVRIALEGGFCGLGRGTFASTSEQLTQLGSTAGITVSLIGEPEPPVSLEPSPAAFGRLEPSQLSLRTVTITALTEVTVNRISMERANYFAITDPNRCVGSRLAVNARCSFKTVFVAPAEAGRTGLRDRITVETTRGSVTDTVEGST